MKKYLTIIILVFFISGCEVAPKQPTLTPLEIQSLQTRQFETNMNTAFPSVISVFQDLGYIVQTASKDTGLITAKSEAKKDSAYAFWTGNTKVKQTAVTAFVEQLGKNTKVRLNFVASAKRSSAWGQTDQDDTPILEAKIYQNAFERIGSAIFVRTSTN